MRVVAILQARVSSSRLPGKVLMPILGQPMLFRQIERLNRCKEFEQLVVATSVDPSDDVLVSECAARNIACSRGSLNDVLDRFIQAASPYRPETLVRLTGDCPVADPELIDNVIRYFHAGDYDYVSNCNPPTFPDGLDVEVMRFGCLEQAHQESALPSEREHVTPYLWMHPERFRLGNYSSSVDRSALRWTVDEPEDFEAVRLIYENLYSVKRDFNMDDILRLLEKHPELRSINSRFSRNEGLKKSLQADEQFLTRNR
jgi:spore coat polysaccharide biosynthesis protein SpsF (cytidylyltransferase family)